MKKKIRKRTPVKTVKRTYHHPLHVSTFGVISIVLLGLAFSFLAFKPQFKTFLTSSNVAQPILKPILDARWKDSQNDFVFNNNVIEAIVPKSSTGAVQLVNQKTLSFTPINANTVPAELNNDIITYPNTYTSSDVQYQTTLKSLKKSIVLRSPNNLPSEFTYRLDAPNLDIDLQSDNSIFFTQNTKEPSRAIPVSDGTVISKEKAAFFLSENPQRFKLVPPVMVDAQGKKSELSDLKVLYKDNILTLSPSKAWLQKATFPVRLESTIEAIPHVVEELAEKRTLTSKVFLNNDGSYRSVITLNPLHYLDGQTYKDIDRTIKPSKDPRYQYEVETGIYKAKFKKDLTDPNGAIDLFFPDATIGLSPLKIGWSNGDVLGRVKNVKGLLSTDKSSLIYPSLFGINNIDLEAIYDNERFLKETVIKNPEGLQVSKHTRDNLEITFTLNLPQDIDLQVDGKIWDKQSPVVTDKQIGVLKNGKEVFALRQAVAYDKNSQNKHNITIRLAKEGDKLTYTKIIDGSWLAKAVYPVRTDSALNLQPDATAGIDTQIESLHPTWNQGVAGLAIGESSLETTNKRRTLIKFDLSSLPADAVISATTVSLYFAEDRSSNTRTTRIFRAKLAWLEGTGSSTASGDGATWNTYDGVNAWQTAGGFGANDTEQTDIGTKSITATEALNAFKAYSLTPTTKSALDLGNGWMFKADTELNDAYNIVPSDGATASQRPKLDITYITTPPAPVASAATSIGPTSFTANWAAATDATSYILDVASDSGFTSFISDGCAGTSCSAKNVGNVTTYAVSSATNIVCGTTYYYRVRGTNAAGTGANSSTISPITIPCVPTSNAASSVTDTTMSTNWSASTGASSYLLSVSTNSGCASSYVTACEGGTTSCNLLDVGNVTTEPITALSGNTTYYYCLKAANASGNSALSNIITQITAPAAPTVSAGTSITTTGFSANWSASTGATKYYLDVANDSGFTSYTGAVATACEGASCQNKDVGNVTTYAVTPLSGGTTYYYRVRAYSTNGTSNNSGTTIVTTVPAAPTVNPGVAVDSTSTSTGGPAASLTWSHTISGSNRLLVVGVTMRANQTITSVTYGGTALTKSGAVQAGTGDNPRTEIWYSRDFEPITGTNNIVVTPSASEYMEAGAVSFTGVYQTTKLGPFASNSALSGSPSTVSVISATGDIVLDALKFWNNGGESTKDASQTQRWYLSSDGGHKGGGSTKTGAGSVTMSWTRTDNNAWSHAGISVKSYQSSITQTGFSANWSASTGATKYYLDVAKDSGFTNFTAPLDTACGGATCNNKDVGNVTTYDVGSNLTAGTTYYYRVRAYNASGTSTSSSTVTIITGPTTNNASNVYSGNLQANWTAVSGATSYELDVASTSSTCDFSSGFVSGYNPATGITANYKMIPGLTPNTLYCYRVRVIKSGVTSGNSSTISKRTKPTSPTSVTSSSPAVSSFTVSWTAPTGGASSYKLDVATNDTFTKFAPDASYGSWQNVTATSPRVVNNLFPGTTYYFRVRALNADGLASPNPTTATPSATTTAATDGAPCQSVDGTNTTINYSCTFLNSLDGIGNGDLAVATGKTLTVTNGQSIVWTPGKKIDLTGGGQIVLNTGASLKQGYMTYPDTDGDGYPDSLTPVFNATGIADGYKARYQMNAGYTLDCDPNLTTGGGGGNDCNTKTVFVTNTAYTGSLGGLGGADTYCNTAASDAGLTGYYRAWLSDGSTSALARNNHYGYKYQLVDGTDVAYGWSDLIDGSLQAAINKDEYGTTVTPGTLVWTNTNSNGSGSTLHCSSWGSTSGSGGNGTIGQTDGSWTTGAASSCNASDVHLMCFEQ